LIKDVFIKVLEQSLSGHVHELVVFRAEELLARGICHIHHHVRHERHHLKAVHVHRDCNHREHGRVGSWIHEVVVRHEAEHVRRILLYRLIDRNRSLLDLFLDWSWLTFKGREARACILCS